MHQGYSILVHLSTCQPGLTEPEVNKGLQDIMANPYIFICRSVNLSFCPVYFPAVLLSMLYMEYSFFSGGLWGLPPGAVPCLFHRAVQDYSLTSLQ